MKILQIIPYFVPAYGYGGPLKVCFDISRELVKHGHEITVATTDTLDGRNRIKKLEEEINSIEVIRFRNISNWMAKNYNGYLPLRFYFWAKKNLKKYDMVHCHDFFTLQNIITAHFCKKYSVPFLIQPHGTLSSIRQKAEFRLIKKIFLKLFSSVLKNSKNIIALTENEKQEIISVDRDLKNKIKIIPNGVRLEEFENIKKIDLHQKYELPQENKIIGYFGRIQYIKGIDISLKILANLKDKLKFTYLIIGPNEGEKEKLKNQIKKLGLEKNVIFTGILEGKEKLEIIKSCNVFLFTSRNEGLPMTILEVAALGVPQILSKNCHVPEIEKFNAGEIFSLKEKQKIADSLTEILHNQEEIKKMSQNAQKMIQEKFKLEKVCNKIEKTYQEFKS